MEGSKVESMSHPADVVLIAGPPCSGKTTLAHDLATPEDLVIDFDDIARELGSPVDWVHPEPYRSMAESEIRSLMSSLPGVGSGTAYVIRSAASGRSRAIAAKSIGARLCVVMTTEAEECLRRAAEDGRPDGTESQIEQWFDSFSSWSGDTYVSGD